MENFAGEPSEETSPEFLRMPVPLNRFPLRSGSVRIRSGVETLAGESAGRTLPSTSNGGDHSGDVRRAMFIGGEFRVPNRENVGRS